MGDLGPEPLESHPRMLQDPQPPQTPEWNESCSQSQVLHEHEDGVNEVLGLSCIQRELMFSSHFSHKLLLLLKDLKEPVVWTGKAPQQSREEAIHPGAGRREKVSWHLLLPLP